MLAVRVENKTEDDADDADDRFDKEAADKALVAAIRMIMIWLIMKLAARVESRSQVKCLDPH